MAFGIEHYAAIVKMDDCSIGLFYVITHYDALNNPGGVMMEADLDPFAELDTLLREV